MAEKTIVLTYEGLQKLEAELAHLKTVRRRDVAEKIKEARAQGDLSENAEYDAAKEEQGEIESRIVEIEKILRNASIIDEDELEVDIVNVGCKVKVYDKEFDEQIEYVIVGSTEANPMEGKISNESPVGEALIGKKIGDSITAETPDGVIEMEIIDIYR